MSSLDKSPNQPKRKSKKPAAMEAPFVDQVEALFRRYGYRDWAVVVRAQGKAPERWCAAGDGQDWIADREAMGTMYYELADLQAIIVKLQREQELEARQAKIEENKPLTA